VDELPCKTFPVTSPALAVWTREFTENPTFRELGDQERKDKRADDFSHFLGSRLEKEMRADDSLNGGFRPEGSHLVDAVRADEPILNRLNEEGGYPHFDKRRT